MSSSSQSQDKRDKTENKEKDDNQMEMDDQTEKEEDDQLNRDETISSLRYNKEFRKVFLTKSNLRLTGPDLMKSKKELNHAPCGLRSSTTSYIY